MGRKRIYNTEEEVKEANRLRALKYERQKNGYTKRTDLTTSYNKHHYIKDGPLKFDIGTLDKIGLMTMFIDCVINISYSLDKKAFKALGRAIKLTITGWLVGQSTYDPNRFIYVYDMPESNRDEYSGRYTNLNFQLHVLRRSGGLTFDRNVNELLPLVTDITETIKITCQEAGLNLVYRISPNSKLAKNRRSKST